MRRQALALSLVTAVALIGVSPGVVAAVTSKTYEYKADIKLETGVDIGQGLKLESVLFKSPSSIGKKFCETRSTVIRSARSSVLRFAGAPTNAARSLKAPLSWRT